MRTGITLLIGAAMAAVALPAAAQSQDEVVITSPGGSPNDVDTLSVRVSYGDLDLATLAGRSELSWRIKSAARDVCDRLRHSSQTYLDTTQCRDDAANSAFARVGTRYARYAPNGAGTAWLASR